MTEHLFELSMGFHNAILNTNYRSQIPRATGGFDLQPTYM